MKTEHSHYFKDVSAYDYITISDVIKLWNCDNKYQKKIVKHIFSFPGLEQLSVHDIEKIDIYRLSNILGIESTCHHILKKTLVAGQRGHKDLETDVQNIIDTANRALEMIRENGKLNGDVCFDMELDEKILKKITRSSGKWLASLQSDQENDPPDWVYEIPAGGVQCRVSNNGFIYHPALVTAYDSNSSSPYITGFGNYKHAKPITELEQ